MWIPPHPLQLLFLLIGDAVTLMPRSRPERPNFFSAARNGRCPVGHDDVEFTGLRYAKNIGESLRLRGASHES